LSRAVWPELKSHALTNLAENFGISYNAHNALEDAQTCGIIACKAAEKYACTTLGELLRITKMEMRGL
jgi:DNA polymerase-3 subunit epsilon